MRTDKNYWLYTKPIAHRGLWNNSIAENTLSAYQNAIDYGFPIEIDVFSSLDNVLYSFHDDNLFRMTEKNGLIFNTPSTIIDKLIIKGSTEKIPTFDDVLKLVNGKVPILIEIKNQPNKKIVDLVLDKLKNYNGEFALQSFNPLYLIKLKKLAPQYIRGILTTKEKKDLQNISFIKRFIIKYTPLNFLAKPDFISRHKNMARKKSKHFTLAWTIENNNQYKLVKPYSNNIIFEGFIPKK